MGTARIQPKWWTEQHVSQWDNLKTALQRDWEQTKKDLHLGGHELHQDAGDTLKQAGGSEPIPPKPALTWDYAQEPLKFGVGAREQYGSQHMAWNDNLETTLKNDWDTADGGAIKRKWDEVKGVVRHGYERAAKH